MTYEEYKNIFELLEDIQLKLLKIEVMQGEIDSNSTDECKKEMDESEKNYMLNWYSALSNVTLDCVGQLQESIALVQDSIYDFYVKDESIKECEI